MGDIAVQCPTDVSLRRRFQRSKLNRDPAKQVESLQKENDQLKEENTNMQERLETIEGMLNTKEQAEK